MAERTCYNCVYCVCDPCLWLRWLWEGLSIVPQCANHPRWPGELHDVPGVPCRNYRPKPAAPQGPGVRMIPLSDGGYAYVDAADYDWLNQYTWRLSNGYASRYEKGKIILMHREILKPPLRRVVDHADGNKVNNCRWNIRAATREQNMRNKRKRSNSSSRFKCVFYDKRTHKWYARCRYQGKNRVLGYFGTEEEAARAYDRAAVEWFGPFARLNFPNEWPPERRAQVYAEYQKNEKREKGRRGKHAKTRGTKAKGRGDRRTVGRRRVARLVTSDVTGPTKRASQPRPLDDPTTSARAETRGRRGQQRVPKPARATAARPGRRVKRKKTRRGE